MGDDIKKNNEIDFNDLEKYNISSLTEYERSTQNSKIQFELGARYYLGKKVKQVYKKAVKWFELSAEQGDDAQKELKKIQKKASGIDCYDAVVEISEGASTKVLSNSLENGNDPDVIYSVNDSDGEYDFSITALALAVKMLDTETFSKVLKIFLKYNASINKADNEGDTALHVACKLLDREKANILIHYGADVDIENEKGLTPKDYFTNAMEKQNNKKKVGGTIGAFIGGVLGDRLELKDDEIKDLRETFGEFGSWLGGKF